MITAEEIRKLAALSRLIVTDDELEKFTSEFDGIVAYVGQLEEVAVGVARDEKPPLRNVMREDGTPHAPRAFTEKLAEQFPAREGDALSVKQIISHD